MLTITPTGVMDSNQGERLEVYAVIGGKKIYLPPEANYVMQDRRGIWYYCSRKPRPKEGDWTPNKTSISCKVDGGYVRALRTPVEAPWLHTCQRTVRMVSGVNGEPRRPADG